MTGLRSVLLQREHSALTEAAELVKRSRPGDVGSLARLESALDEADRAGRLAARVKSEPLTYSEHGPHSFYRDLLAAHRGENDATARLQRHHAEVAVERRDITRLDGAGGEFVPPLWVLEYLSRPVRTNRPFADAIGSLTLPPETDNLSLPIVTASGTTAPQTADNAPVNQLNPSTGPVNMPVRTITGEIPASMQLIDQTPVGVFDAVYMGELIDDYDASLETQLWNGSGTAGQLLGLLNVSGITSVTYTDGTPTVPELTPKVAELFGRTFAARKRADVVGFMVPQRWAWIAGSLHSSNRPIGDADTSAPDGERITWAGQQWALSPGLPVNLGAGTNEDRIVATRLADHLLLEGTPRARVIRDVAGSSTFTLKVQMYRYVAFTAARRPAASGSLGGTGLVAPW